MLLIWWDPSEPMMLRDFMDIAVTLHGCGRDTDFTHKNYSIECGITRFIGYFEIYTDHGS